MDFSRIQERYSPIIRTHWLPLTLGFFGMICLVYGLIALSSPKSKNEEIVFEKSSATQSSTGEAERVTKKEISVDIEGAILKPGVYRLPAESRVQDGLIAAGGLSDKADRHKVATGMNLAAKLVDGGKIYIPFQGEAAVAQGGNSSAETGVLGAEASGTVNINSASEKDLESLPGVGPATAQKIISARPYATIDELLSKKIVGKSVFGKIKEKVTVN